MKVTFHTNLDLAKGYVFDIHRGALWTHVPRVGERIEFVISRSPRKTFDLAVVGVTYATDGESVSVELHMPPTGESIRDWEARMKRHMGSP